MDETWAPLICGTCGDPIPADGRGVGLWKGAFGLFSGEVWIPRIEDGRSTDMHLVHAVCFSNERGQDALDDLIEEQERQARR